MTGMALPRAVVRFLCWVAPHKDNQAQVPPGSKIRLIVSSTWNKGSVHHSKTSLKQQEPFILTHNPGILEVGGWSENMNKKKGHLQRDSLRFYLSGTDLQSVTA